MGRILVLPEVRPLWNQELLSKIGQEWRLKDPSLRFYDLDSWRASVVTGGEEILSEVGIFLDLDFKIMKLCAMKSNIASLSALEYSQRRFVFGEVNRGSPVLAETLPLKIGQRSVPEQ